MDPMRESVQRQVKWLHVLNGHQGNAIRQYLERDAFRLGRSLSFGNSWRIRRVSIRRVPRDSWPARSNGIEQSVGPERINRFGEAKAAMQAEPFSGAAVPLEV